MARTPDPTKCYVCGGPATVRITETPPLWGGRQLITIVCDEHDPDRERPPERTRERIAADEPVTVEATG